MLLIDCPYCGKRPELEFTYGGQAHLVRPPRPAELDDQTWTDFLYMRANTKGVYAERWRHARGCGRFFNAVRDTTTDHFVVTYESGTTPAAASRAAADAGTAATTGSSGTGTKAASIGSPGTAAATASIGSPGIGATP